MLAADDRLARRVGAVTLALVAAATLFFVFVYPRIERAKRRIVVTFQTTGGLREGAAFVVAGQPVGRVERIGLGDGCVRVVVALDRDRALPYGGDVFVTSRGIVSERYLELGPAPPDARPLRDGDVIAGRDPPTLDQALQRSWANLVIASAFADAVAPELRALQTELGALRETLDELPPSTLREAIVALALEAGRTELPVLDVAPVLAQARSTVARLRASAGALQASLRGLRTGELVAHVEVAVERTRHALDAAEALLAQVDAVRAMIANQQGSLMRLLHDPEFPEDAKAIGKVLERSPWRAIARPAD